jgi:hypothetical protein
LVVPGLVVPGLVVPGSYSVPNESVLGNGAMETY